MKTIRANLTITKPQNSDGRKYVKISVQDEASRHHFMEMEVALGDFTEVLTGLAHVKALKTTVRGLENVGRVKVYEKRSIHCPLDSYDRNELQLWLMEHAQEEGWLLDGYLGSQNSVVPAKTGCTLNYKVYKYEDQA